MGLLKHWFSLALLANAIAASPVQIPLQETIAHNAGTFDISEQQLKKRPLHGRFLHVTDFHPDRFYEVYSSTEEDDACHHGQGPAGVYGAESSDCDSPIGLVNKTMDYIKKELRDSIDFVVWTGDSARHDNDEDFPRNDKQVLELNEYMVQNMYEVFGKKNGDEGDNDPTNDYIVPIVPTFGNNDILPHNIFRTGPNKWTRTYSKMWRQFIPEAQRHQFEQGGWFYVEVIPNKLAVFSLNTMYFFTSNAAADGCAAPSEPGYKHMEWLRVQLQFMRDRRMKVILIGHVPPAREEAKLSWDETCWQKYTLWLRQYRDIIITSIYGHFNYDHFILQDFKTLDDDTKNGKMSDYDTAEEGDEGADEFRVTSKADYFVELRDTWSKLPDPPKSLDWPQGVQSELEDLDISEQPYSEAQQRLVDVLKSKKKKEKRKRKKFLKKMGGEFAENFAASFVSASVVPNLFPTIRVFEYNITGMDERSFGTPLPTPDVSNTLFEESDNFSEAKKKTKYKFVIPESPSKSTPPGPAYSPQLFSLLGYVQYFANLTHINNDFNNLESAQDDITDYLDAVGWREGKHKGNKPHSKDHTPNPKKFKYEVLYDTRNDDIYQLKDLTMPNLVDLARRIGKFKAEKSELVLASEAGDEDVEAAEKVADEEVNAGSKKDKKNKKKEKRRQQNEAWYTFIKRAYVETMSSEELKEEFG